MSGQGRNTFRYQDLCEEFEAKFGEAFWMPQGLGLSKADGIYAILRCIESNTLSNGYEAFGLEPPREVVA